MGKLGDEEFESCHTTFGAGIEKSRTQESDCNFQELQL